MRVELPDFLSGNGDHCDPQLEGLSAPAKASFQVSDEARLDETSTASPPVERPRVRSADHQLDMLALAVFAPCHGVGEVPRDDLLQRRRRLQRLEVRWDPPRSPELLLVLPIHVPVDGEGSVPPQIPLACSVFGPFAVGARHRRRGWRKPDVPGCQAGGIADEQPDGQRLRFVESDPPARSTPFTHFGHQASKVLSPQQFAREPAMAVVSPRAAAAG